MDENNAAPARDASEASENINQVTQAAGGATDNSSATAEQVAKFLGTDAATLEEFTKFTNANGKFNKAFDVFKSKISNPAPAPAPAPAEEQKPAEPAQPVSAPQEPEYKAPAGSITRDEYFTKRYFLDLAGEEKYAGIAKEIASGEVLKEMASLGIRAVNQDGSINASVVNEFLDLKAKTVPAKQSSAMPEAAAAPTVDYIPVGDSIRSMEEARAIIMQDTELKRSGQAGHPNVKMAEDYLRDSLSKQRK